MTTYLCECIGVSKSGYYNYLKNENKRIERDNKDQKDFDLILKAYKFKKRKKGARQINMVLDILTICLKYGIAYMQFIKLLFSLLQAHQISHCGICFLF